MFLQYNDLFPTVVYDSELSNDLLQELRDTELQETKMSANEETHVQVYESLIPLVESISQIRIEQIHKIHKRLFHYDEGEVKGYLLHALYKIIKEMWLEDHEFKYCNDRFGENVMIVKRELFHMLIFSIEELRDQEEYNHLIRDSDLWNILRSQPPMDREYIKREMDIFLDVLEVSQLSYASHVTDIVNISLSFYRSSYLARLGLYDPAYPPDETWHNLYQLRNAPHFDAPRDHTVEDEEWYYGSD